jgi:hypothetical protein
MDNSATLPFNDSSSIEQSHLLQVFKHLETWATTIYLETTVVNTKKCALLKQIDRPLLTVGDLTKFKELIILHH